MDEKLRVLLNVEFTREEMKSLDDFCECRAISKSKLVRKLVRMAINKEITLE